MGLRFFADHCIPNSIIQRLLDAGHEVFRLKDHIPVESPDPFVIVRGKGPGLAITHFMVKNECPS
jgi:hypothetical protein